MDKNNLIGFVLIFFLVLGYTYFTAPSPEEIAEQQRLQDSIEMATQPQTPLPSGSAEVATTTNTQTPSPNIQPDSIKNLQLVAKLGVFANAGAGTEQTQVLENDLVKVTFTNKGGRIQSVELKEYTQAVETGEKNTYVQEPVRLMKAPENRFEYLLPFANLPSGSVSTQDLYFEPQLNGNTITFRAYAQTGGDQQGYVEQSYTLEPDAYSLEYAVKTKGLDGILANNTENVQLNWVNFLQKIEKGTWFERTYSGVYFKETDEDTDYCSCRGDDEENVEEPIKWVATANQFFNTTIVAENAFAGADLAVKMFDEEAPYLKRIDTKLAIPKTELANGGVQMKLFVGPNEFDRLKSYASELEQIIPYGWSIFGTINRYVIRPLFQFLLPFVGSKGIAILILTLIIKALVYPLTYRMLYSQQKMAALKPRLEGLNAKFKDDPQKKQMETMKIYQEYGVSPLGGCLPMILQMPIWYALFRFFPSSIDFRQAGFLWADDLSSYDAFFQLPFELPLNMGSHLSLFAILWAISMVAYTFYNSRHMDMSANPAMKYMQYLMPVLFFGFFNAYAAGLTCYMLFSNLLNITQYVVTKEFIIDKEKIKQELEAHKNKPKKTGGFRDRLQQALQEQQRMAAEQEAARRKKKKK